MPRAKKDSEPAEEVSAEKSIYRGYVQGENIASIADKFGMETLEVFQLIKKVESERKK